MNTIAFTKALAFTLKEEGGFVNDPDDHGGPTNRGITQHTYDTYRQSHSLPLESVEHIADAEVREIYAQMYWAPARCDELSQQLATAHFDWAVNHGPAGAIHTLQDALGITPDGIFGAATRSALLDQDQPPGIWQEYDKLRRDHYEAIVKKDSTQAEFLADWLGRVDRLDAYIESL